MIGWLKWGALGVQLGKLGTLEDVIGAARQLAAYTQASAEFMAALSKLDLLQGKRLTVAIDNTTLANFFPHGLGRPFRGVIVLGQSGTTVAVTAWDPATVALNGQDPGVKFMLRYNSANAINATVWVF